MDIRIKESLFLRNGSQEYVVRCGSIGAEHNKVVYFYDVTKSMAVGFPRQFCIENPQMFQVSRTLSDREVSVNDVIKGLKEMNLPADIQRMLEDKVNSL